VRINLGNVTAKFVEKIRRQHSHQSKAALVDAHFVQSEELTPKMQSD
jgi:hypothetical protein